MRNYIRGGIGALEGFANALGGTGFSGRRTATRRSASATAGRTSGS